MSEIFSNLIAEPHLSGYSWNMEYISSYKGKTLNSSCVSYVSSSRLPLDSCEIIQHLLITIFERKQFVYA